MTSTYHVSRARVLFNQCFDGQLAMVEAPTPRTRAGFLAHVAREVPDLVASLTFARAC